MTAKLGEISLAASNKTADSTIKRVLTLGHLPGAEKVTDANPLIHQPLKIIRSVSESITPSL
jgi:hypothetical protein